MARIRKLSEWLERERPGSRFTINRLQVPPSLHFCLSSTNIIESPHAGGRWVDAAFLAPEKGFRRIMGYQDLWALKSDSGRSR